MIIRSERSFSGDRCFVSIFVGSDTTDYEWVEKDAASFEGYGEKIYIPSIEWMATDLNMPVDELMRKLYEFSEGEPHLNEKQGCETLWELVFRYYMSKTANLYWTGCLWVLIMEEVV